MQSQAAKHLSIPAMACMLLLTTACDLHSLAPSVPSTSDWLSSLNRTATPRASNTVVTDMQSHQPPAPHAWISTTRARAALAMPYFSFSRGSQRVAEPQQ